MSPFGPLFRYELTRLARRGLQPRLRAAFAGLLLVILFLSYLAAFPEATPRQVLTHLDTPLTTEASSRFGERFLVMFLFVQAAVVVLITPAIAVGALGEDKARGTLDVLLTTSLTSWEIVAGKLLARLAFVGSLLLTGLPVVALVILFGGVDIEQLIVGYAIALLTILSIGTFSLCISLSKATLEDAIFRSYLWVLMIVVWGAVGWREELLMAFSPIGMLIVLFEGAPRGGAGVFTTAIPWKLLAIYAAVHLLLTLILAFIAVRLLRPCVDRARGDSLVRALHPDDLRDDRGRIPSATPPARTRKIPPVDDANPLGWKERYFGGFTIRGPGCTLGGSAVLGLVMLLFIQLEFGNVRLRSRIQELLGFILTLSSMIGIVLVGLKATNSVAPERQNGTLDSLLTIPGERRQILFAKAGAAFQLCFWPASLIALTVLALLLHKQPLPTDSEIPLMFLGYLATLIGLPLVFAGWVAAAIGFGLWLSVRCATRERALAWYFGLGFVVCVIVPMTGVVVQDRTDVGSFVWSWFIKGLSPLVGLWNANPLLWDRYSDGGEMLACYGAMLGGVVAGLVGVFLGSRAMSRFERND